MDSLNPFEDILVKDVTTCYNGTKATAKHDYTFFINYYIPPAMEGSPTPGYRAQIQSCFDRRKTLRPAYSLRAFARDLSYGAPQLSRVLNGKQNLSLANARTLADRLFDSEHDRELFVAQVELESAQTENARNAAEQKVARVRKREFGEETVTLQPEDFMVISDWYHLPILYLASLPGAPSTTAGFAKFLGIGKAEANQAIERLVRLKLLRPRTPQEGSGWCQTHVRLYVPTSPKANGGIRKFHRSMIEKAHAAVEGLDNERRYIAGRTLAISPHSIPKFRALIDDFLARTSVLGQESKNATELYQFNVQMFDLKVGG